MSRGQLARTPVNFPHMKYRAMRRDQRAAFGQPRGRRIRPTRSRFTGLWWLSFVDPDKAPPLEQRVPGGPSFLGVAIVPGLDFIDAVTTSHALGCNPGGAVQGSPLPGSFSLAPDPRWWGRLLTREEIAELETEMAARHNHQEPAAEPCACPSDRCADPRDSAGRSGLDDEDTSDDECPTCGSPECVCPPEITYYGPPVTDVFLPGDGPARSNPRTAVTHG